MIAIKERNTVQRTLILQAVRSMTNHPTADEVYERVAVSCPGISKGTVYRDLNRLAAQGEILRVAVANAPDRYDLTARSHAHAFCTDCGRVFDYRLHSTPQLDDTANTDFFATGMDIIVRGTCRTCRARGAQQTEG